MDSQSIAKSVDGKPRARRALPLIGGALTVVVVASLVYLRSTTPPPNTAAVTPAPTAISHLHGTYATTFDFIDPSHGWALALDYTQPGSRFWIFATSDAAAHWRRQFSATAPPGSGYGPSTNVYIHFFDMRHGFAYAGNLYRTVDGGARWDLVQTPTGGPLFTFASSTKGWIMSFEGAASAHLYATADGGTTWTATATPLPPLVNVSPVGDRSSFDFRDDDEGWLGAAVPQPAVYLTLDGGKSWTTVTIPAAQSNENLYITSVRVLPAHGVVALVGSPDGSGAGYYSDDHGQTWRQVAPALPQPDWLADASFVDATHWWVARFGFLYKTSTAGEDWSRVLVRPLPDGWNIGPVHVIDVDNGWWSMISTTDSRDTALMMTSDGGADWRPVNMPQPA